MSEAPGYWDIKQPLEQLYKLAKAMREEAGGDADSFFERLEAAKGDVRAVTLATCLAAIEAEQGALAIEAHMQDLDERRTRYWRRSEAYRNAAKSIMELVPQAFPEGKLRDALLTAYLAMGKPGVIVTDESKLEDRFVIITRTPNKTAIAEAILGDGEVVEGAEVKNAAPHLVIRVK